ncbi:damage-inducible protein CinA [Pedobacter lusitanus]|uniref:Damage-inducible protein CinA n=1 Tax=Pedobacter lusitanus TaxID=1503925 RepID=A0A0D0GJG6_9SPHI|nr:nicotinamide-nucleotide amidohydrolase family protein [Pedobacter lusitanus]KIO77357.1 damage-inducible protein CinA [Pedobacter lusitanus]
MRKDIDLTHLLACGEMLIKHNLTLAFAESATAGRLSAEFALIPDAGKFLKGGIVCYDADLKCTLLDVPQEQLKAFTPESEIVTCSITAGLQKLIPADIHIGCTGLTAPGGSETTDKPVGTMFLYGVKSRELLFSERSTFQGAPEEIVRQTVEFLAQRLHNYLKFLK